MHACTGTPNACTGTLKPRRHHPSHCHRVAPEMPAPPPPPPLISHVSTNSETMGAAKKEIKNKIAINPKSKQWSFIMTPSRFKPFTQLPQGITYAAVTITHDNADKKHIQGFIKMAYPLCSDNLRSLIGLVLFTMVEKVPHVLMEVLTNKCFECGRLPLRDKNSAISQCHSKVNATAQRQRLII